MALGLMQAAREQGRHLPGDLKITGIDDFALAASAVPPLTTYRVPYEELGRRAFETLNAQMNGGPPGSGEVQVRGELVVRASA
ncbi:MAG: substrate-binding domain-containing protein [Verrucomicrobiota bacterium]